MKSDKNKVLHELAGLPMISWLLLVLEALEPEKIIVVCAPDAKDVQAVVKDHTIAIQEVVNGTGGALKAALPALEGFEGDVLVTLGDAPLVSAQTLSELARGRAGAGLTILGMQMNDPAGYGRLCTDESGIVHKIVEEKDASDQEKQIQIVNTGVMCIDGARLADWLEQIEPNNTQGEYYLTDLPEIAARDGKKTTALFTRDISEVQGCNTQFDLAALENTLQNRLRKTMLENGVQMIDPQSVTLHYDTQIAPGAVIEPNVYFGPEVQVEDGVRIKAFSHIEGAVIRKGASVGPFARIRPGTDVGEDARIGNFVEIKKSAIGKGSKIGHLAYVGDTEMAEEVNFSAGAITVNYDGYDKHKTEIGKGVMVGSNVNLVAPVKIEDGAFIAAGSTITKDVPADALSIAREEESVQKGWAKSYRDKKKKA